MLYRVDYTGYTDFFVASCATEAEQKARLLACNGSFTLSVVSAI